MGFWTSVALMTAAIGSAVAQNTQAKAAAKKSMPSLPAPMTVEDVKSESVEAAKASSAEKRRAIARSGTIFTSPLGLQEEATTAKKTLLGR